jgi:hypothetical protein
VVEKFEALTYNDFLYFPRSDDLYLLFEAIARQLTFHTERLQSEISVPFIVAGSSTPLYQSWGFPKSFFIKYMIK